MRADPNASKRCLLVRCDAGMGVGLGHVSRCIALAEAFARGGWTVRFVGRFDDRAQRFLAVNGFPAQIVATATGSPDDAEQVIALARAASADAVLVDSYAVSTTYLECIERRIPVWLIDDFGLLERYALRAVLNFTVGARHLGWRTAEHTRLLLGPRFFPARHALVAARGRRHGGTRRVTHLLLAIGGFDLHHINRRVLEALLPLRRSLVVHLVVDRNDADRRRLLGRIGRFLPGSRLLSDLPSLGDQFRWADLCIAGGGLTKYEAAYCGLPTASIAQTTEQHAETRAFSRCGLAVDLGFAPATSNRQLRRRLRGFLGDRALQARLRRNGLRTFGANPAATAAQALVDSLSSTSSEGDRGRAGGPRDEADGGAHGH